VLAFLDEPHANTDFGSMLSAPLVGNMVSEIAPYLGLETDASLLPKGEVKVPDLVNAQHREWDMAQVELNKLGLDHRRVGGGPIVLAQYPVSGTMVPGGTTVYLYTDSADIRNVPVPDVKGKSAPLASQMMAGAGLNVKLEGPEEGIITAQDVTGGSEIPMGTLVTLTSEMPPESEPKPSPEDEPEPSESPQNED
ncbi:stage V sporulation protein D, partial [gut metagenome]